MRFINSTTEVFEQRVAAAEGGVAAIAVANQQLARTLAVLNLVEAGDHLVASSSLQGHTLTFFSHTLPRLGIRTRFTALHDLKAVAHAIDHQTRAVYVETFDDSINRRTEISSLARLAHDFNVPLIVDHCAGSPTVKPVQLGADIVLLSTSRWLAEADADSAGVIIDGGRFAWSATSRFHHHFGEMTGDTLAYTRRLRTYLLPTIGVPLSGTTASQLLDAMSATGPRVPSDDAHVQGHAA